MKTLTLIIDLDSIIIDLMRPWLALYNQDHDDNVTVDDLITYEITNHTKKATSSRNVYRFFEDKLRYANCPVLPGASEGLKILERAGHDIIIATATAGSTADVKWVLVKKAAPWLHHRNVMVGSRKEKLTGDIFIDDAPANIIKYRAAWPKSHILTISYPYNKDIKDQVDCYAMDHNHTEQAWKELTDYVRSVSRGEKDNHREPSQK